MEAALANKADYATVRRAQRAQVDAEIVRNRERLQAQRLPAPGSERPEMPEVTRPASPVKAAVARPATPTKRPKSAAMPLPLAKVDVGDLASMPNSASNVFALCQLA